MALRRIMLTVGNVPIDKAKTWAYPAGDDKYYEIPTYELTVKGTRGDGSTSSRVFEVLRFGVHLKKAQSNPSVVGLADEQSYTIRAWLPTYTVHSGDSAEFGAWQVHGEYLIHDGPDDPRSKTAPPLATAGCIEICGSPRGFDHFNDHLIELSGATQPTRAEKLLEVGKAGIIQITYKKAKRPPLVEWSDD